MHIVLSSRSRHKVQLVSSNVAFRATITPLPYSHRYPSHRSSILSDPWKKSPTRNSQPIRSKLLHRLPGTCVEHFVRFSLAF